MSCDEVGLYMTGGLAIAMLKFLCEWDGNLVKSYCEWQ